MKLLIDCDPGIDDALALLFAFARPEFDILGITTVEGNAPARLTYQNALRIASFAGRTDVPVVRGTGYRQEDEFPTDCHGTDGMGECSLPVPKVKPIQKNPEDYLLEVLEENASKSVILVTIGPMTNLSLAFRKNPEVFRRAEKIVSMGGGIHCGNITPFAEFNYWYDAEAAKTVYQSGVPVCMIGLNITEKVLITPEIFKNIKSLRTPEARLIEEILPTQFAFSKKSAGRDGMPPHDLVAMAACLAPSYFTWKHCRVNISVQGEKTGESTADFLSEEKNCYLATEVKTDELISFALKTILPDIDL